MFGVRVKKVLSVTFLFTVTLYACALLLWEATQLLNLPRGSEYLIAQLKSLEHLYAWAPGPLVILVALVVGFASAIVASYVMSDRLAFLDFILVRSVSRQGGRSLVPIAAITVGLAALLFLLYVFPYPPDEALGLHYISVLLNRASAGGASLVFGVITVFGITLTWLQLHDVRSTINSFSQLIDRVCDLADSAHPDDPIHIIAYTPALGYLALPEAFWGKYRKAITAKSQAEVPGTKTKMICLEKGELARWHNSFVGKLTHRARITQHEADAATEEAEQVIESICRPHPDEGRHGYLSEHSTDATQEMDIFVYRAKMDRLPGFYVFFTEQRAIIINPLFIPFLSSHPEVPEARTEMVNMIGYVTTDRGVIHDLKTFFYYCTEFCEPERRWISNRPQIVRDVA